MSIDFDKLGKLNHSLLEQMRRLTDEENKEDLNAMSKQTDDLVDEAKRIIQNERS